MNCFGWILVAIAAYSAAAKDENPSMPNCGRSKVPASDAKIVGGRNALPGEFPWQLSFEMRAVPVLTKFQHICGASVINEQWAITAAHCIAGGPVATYRVSAGTSNITTKSLPTKHIVLPYVHEGYSPMVSLSNDIALLRLTTPINIAESNGLINGVCLPDSEMADNVTGMATVTGWGTTSQGGSLSETLRAVDVPIMTDDECRAAYDDMKVEDTMICAGYEEGGKDSCQGDSGGPFVQRNSEGIFSLIGIVSWGKGCAQPKNPGVYTETAHYLDWIIRTMKHLGGPGGQATPSTQEGAATGPAAEYPVEPEYPVTTPDFPDGVVIKT